MAFPVSGRGDSPSTDRMDFARVEALFSEIAALDGNARQRAIDAALVDRPDLQHRVVTLLTAHDRLTAAGLSEQADDSFHSHVGSRVGAYELTAKIGEGGMGEVFRAERADGLFTHAVAVKLTRSTIGHSESRRRFDQERQILASLHHEHIVRLLDGGTLPSGQAFLIMEHVEGVPLTTYCRDHGLSLPGRLALFVKVCATVQYAHQHGVVHRDLKPANVLVDGAGVPKIVDFGIAKLLEGESTSGFTSTGMPGPLTPNYASPEQVRGLPVTAASDIYSLGVLLYEVVAGGRPYETDGQTLERVLAIVAHEAPPRPSARVNGATLPYAPARLAGDIDAIVLKALSKEPADRYGSASEMAADLGRFLGGDPVLARAPSTGYLLRRLLARHKRLAGVAAAALLAVLTASGIAVWQWQAARRAQLRAEQRFNEVRQLANSLIFKVHDAVVPLQGSTPVRRTIVDEAIVYLERLEAESADDPVLRLELANAYRQLGGILGDSSRANLGDREGALVQYRRARQLLLPLAASLSHDAVAALVNVDTTLGTLHTQLNDRQTGTMLVREAVDYATRFSRQYPDDRRGLILAGRAGFFLANRLPPNEAIPVWEETLAIYERLLKENPGDHSNQRNVALVCKYLGGIFETVNQSHDARRLYERSLELDEGRLRAAPSDQQVLFDAAISYSNIASVSDALGDFVSAARFFDRSLAIRRQLVAVDPANMQALERLGFLLGRVARFQSTRDLSLARTLAREAVQVLQRVADTTKSLGTRQELAFASYELGQIEKQLHADDAACRAFRLAHQLYSAGDRIGGRHVPQAAGAAREARTCP
jgi:non-specific serine/threonine protein kinase/serine/threonine-protein kinase